MYIDFDEEMHAFLLSPCNSLHRREPYLLLMDLNIQFCNVHFDILEGQLENGDYIGVHPCKYFYIVQYNNIL